jgi:hypothetical protein
MDDDCVLAVFHHMMITSNNSLFLVRDVQLILVVCYPSTSTQRVCHYTSVKRKSKMRDSISSESGTIESSLTYVLHVWESFRSFSKVASVRSCK